MYSTLPTTPTADGVYEQVIPATAAVQGSGASTLFCIAGVATDGVPGAVTYFSYQTDLQAAFGAGGTLYPNSLVREALSAMPECTTFAGVRVVDGTQTSATLPLVDNAGTPGTIATLVAQRPGTNANAGSYIIALKSGTLTASPVFSLTLTYPNGNNEVFSNIVGYATAGGAYSANAFFANLAAAVNGTVPGQLGSQNWVVLSTQGASTLPPLLGTYQTASGGTDGAANVTSSMLLGTSSEGNSTGVMAFSGTGFGAVAIAGLTDATVVQDLLTFVETEATGITGFAFAMDLQTTDMIAQAVANDLASPLLVNCADWDYVYDQNSGQAMYVSPIGKILGIIMSLGPNVSPANKPVTGATGVTATQRTVGQPIGVGEKGLRQSNGIMYLTKPIPRGGVFGLPHGKASDGSNIADTRMQIYVAQTAKGYIGQYVGDNQTIPPTATPSTAPDTDPTRTAVRSALNAWGASLTSGNAPLLQAFNAVCDMTNNTSATVLQGKLIVNIYGTTLAGVDFAFVIVQVGETVQIQSPAA